MTPNFEEILKRNHIDVERLKIKSDLFYFNIIESMKEAHNAAIEEAYEVDKDAEILKLKIK